MKMYRSRIIGLLLTLVLIVLLVSLLPLNKQTVAQETAKIEPGSVQEPGFSKESGNYEKEFDLMLTVPSGTTVYYSTDGSDPVPDSSSAYVKKYSEGTALSIHDRTGEQNILATAANANRMNQEGFHFYQPTPDQVAKATVIRAMAVDAQGNKSKIVTKTYFVGKNLTTRHAGLPVLSLATDPENLLSDDKGIFVAGNNENYTQHGKEWERLTDMTFFNAKGEIDLVSPVGIRVHGGYTRKYQQKSLNIYFREEYGNKNWKYELIPGTMNHDGTEKTNKYKNFVLRNGGNDTNMTKMTDGFLQSLVCDRNISTQGYQPCVLYLNGEYWGMYNIMEKYSDNWLEEEFGVDKNNVVLIKDGQVDEGEETDIALFEEFKKLAELDMTKEKNYQKFLDSVELTSYLDYYATEIIIGNHDWGLEKNNQFWRSRKKTDKKYEDGKWRWLLHDTEFSMGLWGVDPDLIFTMERSEESEKKDSVFTAVSKNEQFRQALASTVLELLDNNLNYSKNVAKYDALVEFYRPHVMESLYRFGSDWNQGAEEACFNDRVQGFKDTWKGKESRLLNQLNRHFGYKKADRVQVNFTSDCDKMDHVIVNKVEKKLSEGQAAATYYKKDPITVTAPDVDGYRFAGWEVTGGTAADASAKETEITLTDGTASVKANYTTNSEVENKEETPDPDTPVIKITAPKTAKLTSVKSPKKRTMKVKISKQDSVDGYQLVYANNNKFTKAKKTKITKKTTVTIKKLKRKKTYYVKVRAFRENGSKKVYGKFSKIGKVKIK